MEATEITCYPTYGYNKGGVWKIPVRVWLHAKRGVFGHPITPLIPFHSENFEDRISDFIADNQRGQEVQFLFDGATSAASFDGDSTSDQFGLIQGHIILDTADAERLSNMQQSQSGWLSYRAVCGDASGQGAVQLLTDRDGLISIVSDIDDTIKVTEIPAGTEIVLRNTFFRDFVAVPEMAQIYREFLPNVSFHYVSGGPWPLYRPLANFLIKSQGFPAGSFHMRDRNRDLNPAGFLNDLRLLVEDHFSLSLVKKTELENYKFERISELMNDLPHRQFYLMGDSGESDPEAYSRIRDKFPGRVKEIRIRDVVNAEADKGKPNYRLNSMTVRHAPTITHGKSQFDLSTTI
jgi:hypothetical protein